MNVYEIVIIILVLLLFYSLFVCSSLNRKNLELRIKLRHVKTAIECFKNNEKAINEIKEILNE
jgi:hypothetical protein